MTLVSPDFNAPNRRDSTHSSTPVLPLSSSQGLLQDPIPPSPTESANSEGHPLLDLPFSVLIDGQSYSGQCLSLVAAHITGPGESLPMGQSRIVRLRFAFPGYDISLDLEATILPSERDFRAIKLAFTQPTGAHQPQLRHLLNAHIAGDIVDLNQILSVTQIRAPAVSSKPIHRPGSLAQIGRYMGLLALTLALLALLALSLFDRLYVYDLPAPGIVILQGQTLRAISDGQINSLNIHAKQGEIAFSIWATSGDMLSIALPCDCQVSSLGLQVGATVLKGDPILRMSAVDARPEIMAQIARDKLMGFVTGQVEITLPGAGYALGRATQSSLQAALQSQADPALLSLRPEAPIPATYLGQPARLRLFKPLPAALAPLARLRRQLRFR